MGHGFKKQYVMKSSGWLSEDGVTDELAAWMAAFDRVPLLTYREALLAVKYMMEAGDGRDSSDDIALRLKISRGRASDMMKRVRDGELYKH